MSFKIHHGPPGSYKTAGAMGDDFLREAKAGRVIVTNVRGVSRERTLEVFPDLPDSFDVIVVGDKTEEDRHKWATWFHWVPKGAFIFIDEVQDIWPKRWRDADIKALDYPGGLKAATKDDRPFCWDQALDKHRHYNWDIVLTTPSYKKVRDDVKGASEGAFKHKNLGLLGIGGRYIEAMHMADDEGRSASDFLSVNQKKVPSYVWKLYDSTATGKITDTKAGINILKNPRIFILLSVLACCLYFSLASGPMRLFPGSAPSDPAKHPSAPVASAKASAPPSNLVASGVDALGLSPQGDSLTPFSGEGVYIVASFRFDGRWRYTVSYAGAEFTNAQLLDMGYSIKTLGSCGLELSLDSWKRVITCGVPKDSRTKTDLAASSPVGLRSSPSDQPEQGASQDFQISSKGLPLALPGRRTLKSRECPAFFYPQNGARSSDSRILPWIKSQQSSKPDSWPFRLSSCF